MNRFSAGLKSSSPLLKQGAPTQLRLENREHFIHPAQPSLFVVFRPLIATTRAMILRASRDKIEQIHETKDLGAITRGEWLYLPASN
jgi:hypothetical protein